MIHTVVHSPFTYSFLKIFASKGAGLIKSSLMHYIHHITSTSISFSLEGGDLLTFHENFLSSNVVRSNC